MNGRAPLVALLVSVIAGLGIGFGFDLFAQVPSSFKNSPFLRIDPDKIVVADAKGLKPCGECHTPEWEVWKETKHAKGFEEMHKRESAQEILTKMELRTTKRGEALCMRCHYTVGAERKAIAGVSCESCHGPARDWVNVHNKWGDGVKNRSQEDAANREKRITTSRQAGMLRPSSDIYGVTANCFECHTVPSEDLVNRGEHKSGTANFDLVKRVNSIRHNFLQAGTGNANRALSPEHTRVLFVMGRVLAYEYALRGLATSVVAGKYSKAMSNRIKASAEQLDEVITAVPIPAVTEILKVGGKARLVPNNRAELEAAADQIRALGQKFTVSSNGAALKPIDRLIAGEPAVAESAEATPTAAATAGTPAAPARAPGATAPPPPAGGRTAPAGAAPAGGAPAGAPAAVAAPAAANRPELPGKVQNRPSWFAGAGRSGIEGAGECGQCHSEADEWWSGGDKHATAGKRLTGENAKARQIAELYGIGAAGMARGDKICMSCHATVDEANKAVKEKGVSCESCHGAAKQYLEEHDESGTNPQLGMRGLKQAAVRAATCAGCHHISDERLLAAGHPSGASYDIAKASARIEHWPAKKVQAKRAKRSQSYTAVADAALKSAYASETGRRPIPKVTVAAGAIASARPSAPAAAPAAAAPTAASPTAASPTAASRAAASPAAAAPAGTAVTPTERVAAAAPARSSLPPAVPERVRSRGGAPVAVELEDLPEDTKRLTTEELLLLVKRRIERIHAAVRRGN